MDDHIDLIREIALAESEFVQASHRLSSARERLNQLAPINRFPDEVLAEIFLRCVPGRLIFDPQDHTLMTLPTTRLTPLLLSKISRRWRSVALSTPGLWCNIEIFISIKRYHSQINILKDWLRNSGDLSLTIILNICAHEDLRFWSADPPAEIAQVLAQHSERWQTAYLAIPVASFTDIPPCPFPRLTHLTLRTASFAFDSNKFLGMADQIKSLELLSTPASMFGLPKGQIQHIQARFVSAQECYNLLQKNPDVVDCDLEGPYLHPSFQFSEVLTMKKLEKLCISQYHQECVGVLFDSMNLPALQHLRFGARANDVPHGQLISLVQRSGCLLKKLVLEHIDMDDTNLMAILRLVPTLTEFRITIMGIDHGRTMTNRLLHMLTPLHPILEGKTCLLPRLETMNFEAPFIYEEDAMVDLLGSRWRQTGGDPSCARLQHATITNNGSSVENDMSRRVQPLIDKGMKVDLVRIDYIYGGF
ncbi:hypothetical protein AX17_000494 [Amanita inopinata Kibby_2008]|nr:hypothetical protein AX17_000494 [Amanita inopinata Kibby_2008]